MHDITVVLSEDGIKTLEECERGRSNLTGPQKKKKQKKNFDWKIGDYKLSKLPRSKQCSISEIGEYVAVKIHHRPHPETRHL